MKIYTINSYQCNVSGNLSPQDQLCRDAILVDELSNDKLITLRKSKCNFPQEKYDEMENKDSAMKQYGEEGGSDEDYESFGETIDENDNFEESDQILVENYVKFGSADLKLSEKSIQQVPNSNTGDLLEIDKMSKQENTLSTYIHKLDARTSGVSLSRAISVSSADSFSSSYLSFPEKRRNSKSNISRSKSVSSMSSSGGHQKEVQKRSDGKREAWITNQKISKKEHDNSTKHLKNDLIAQDMSSVGCSKQVQVRLTRLSKKTLKQHGCDNNSSTLVSSSYPTNRKLNSNISEGRPINTGHNSKSVMSNTSNSKMLHHKPKINCLIDSSIVAKEFKRKRTFSDSSEFSARIHSYSANIISNAVESSVVKRRKRKEHSSRILSRLKSQKSTSSSCSDSEAEECRPTTGK